MDREPRQLAADVIIVGAGHNGLVAALLLARQGLDVLVLEEQHVIGGAARSERPFSRAPNLTISTGAYLLGLMPPELLQITGVDLPLKRRDPYYFLPRRDGGYLLFGSDTSATRDQFLKFFSARDWRANEALQSEIAALRDDLAPTWLQEPLSIEETAARFVRPVLRQPFIDLCRRPIGDYLERFDFKSDLVKAMYAVTDGFSGLYGTWDTPGTGMNFLVHNMCRLPDSGGTWMIVEGGMGTIAQRFADAARREGARIETRQGVKEILVERNAVRGVITSNGEVVRATTVVVNADPFRMREMVGASTLPAEYNARLDNYKMPGSTFKLNLALKSLPSFTCLPENNGPFGPTIHLLPDEDVVMKSLLDSFRAVQNGELPDFPAIEWYIHTTVDPTVKDAEGHHSSALFVQWVPYELKGKRWEDEETRYARHLLSICDRFAPGTSDLVVDMMVLHPKSIERYFGITQGHIHHVDNSFGFADRLPYAQPISGLYSCSAGTHPAGSVIGCAGHNAAMRVLKDLSHKNAPR
ncbi:MAG: NAD(P)/FAD-dependent oxidoreductase [Vicinamibacterales bacterium]|nr:NAD(P)/FAD-dependent oxidoreductase [Vicinamibacterales bacterium]